jgi:enoyl-CoA hydratase
MELVLTGRQFNAEEAERWSVVSRIVSGEKIDGDEYSPVVKEALDMASKIAGFGQLATQAGKEAVNAGASLLFTLLLSPFSFGFDPFVPSALLACHLTLYLLPFTPYPLPFHVIALDLPLSEGLRLERRLFHSLFATKDQKEGSCLPRLLLPLLLLQEIDVNRQPFPYRDVRLC